MRYECVADEHCAPQLQMFPLDRQKNTADKYNTPETILHTSSPPLVGGNVRRGPHSPSCVLVKQRRRLLAAAAPAASDELEGHLGLIGHYSSRRRWG